MQAAMISRWLFFCLRIRWRPKLPYTQQRVFFLSIQQFVSLGLTPLAALKCLMRTTSLRLHSLTDFCMAKVEKGQTLSAALLAAPYESDAIALLLLKAGEESGQLEKTLPDVLRHLEKAASFQKDVKAAVRYPLFLCGVLGVTFVALCYLLVPQLMQFTSDNMYQTSFATRSLLSVVAFFQGQDGTFLWVLMSAVGLFTLARLTKVGRFCCQYLFLKVPLWGALTMAFQWSYFFYLLSLGIKKSFPLHKAFFMAQTVLSSAPLHNVTQEAGKELLKGRSLAAVLRGAPGIVEEAKVLLELAQQAKDASCVYTKISLFYAERRALLTSYLLSYLGPCFLIVIGSFFLWLVQGLFLPFYEHALSIDGAI